MRSLGSPASGLHGSTLERIVRSFGFAGQGIRYLYATQPNFWIHTFAAGLAVTLAILLDISSSEIALLVVAIGLVLIAEAINTAVEALVDLVSPDFHPLAKTAKDVSAAATLFAAVTAVIVGALVIVPRLSELLRPWGG